MLHYDILLSGNTKIAQRIKESTKITQQKTISPKSYKASVNCYHGVRPLLATILGVAGSTHQVIYHYKTVAPL